jgi:hypothetical protein
MTQVGANKRDFFNSRRDAETQRKAINTSLRENMKGFYLQLLIPKQSVLFYAEA